MAKGIKKLDGAKVRLLLAAILCAGFFIASTGEDEWCSECYPHAGNDLTITNLWPLSIHVHLSGPRNWDLEIGGGQKKTITTRVGLYLCTFSYYSPSAKGKEWFTKGYIFVSPDEPNNISFSGDYE